MFSVLCAPPCTLLNQHWCIFGRGQTTGFPLLWDAGAIKAYIAALNPCAWFKGPVLPKCRALGRTHSSEGTQMEMRQSSSGVHVVLCCAVPGDLSASKCHSGIPFVAHFPASYVTHYQNQMLVEIKRSPPGPCQCYLCCTGLLFCPVL